VTSGVGGDPKNELAAALDGGNGPVKRGDQDEVRSTVLPWDTSLLPSRWLS
jgi:hypothetical protein